MFYQPSRTHVRALVRALCMAPAVFASPLYAQEAPDVQTQLNQIQASLRQMKTDYEQRIATLESQVGQLQRENIQLSAQLNTQPVSRPGSPMLAQSQDHTGSANGAPTAAAPATRITGTGLLAKSGNSGKPVQQLAKDGSVEDAITQVAPPPAAAAPQTLPNLGQNDRTLQFGASLILDAKYAAQSQNPENAYAGTLPTAAEGIPRGFSIGETELALTGAVDNLFRAEARFVLEQTGSSTAVRTEEVYAETLGLPWGTRIKAGKYWSGVGYLNDKHPHQWDFVDLPLVYKSVFGGQLNQTGMQLSWIAPSDDLLFKLGGEIAQGSTAYGENFNGNYNQNKPRVGTIYAKTGGDVGESHSWQGGVSFVRSTTGSGSSANQATYTLSNTNPADDSAQQLSFNGSNTVWIADFVYRWAPFGNPTSQNLKLQGEMFWNQQSGSMTSLFGCDANEACTGSNFTQNQKGFYAQGVYQFMPKWRTAYRYDRVFNPTNSYGFAAYPEVLAGSQLQNGWNPYRNTLMLDWSNSEYSLIRLQLARDNAFGPGLYNNQLFLQYIMSLGAHGAHKY